MLGFSIGAALLWLVSNHFALLTDPLSLFFVAYSIQFALLPPIVFGTLGWRVAPWAALVSIIAAFAATILVGIFSAYNLLHSPASTFWTLTPDIWLPLTPVAAIVVGVAVYAVSGMVGKARKECQT